MPIFTAYFDASRSADCRVSSVAGFVSREHHWPRFEEQWASILRAANPAVEFFHMTDFVSSRNGWEDWKGPSAVARRKALLGDLIACIKKHTNKGFAASLARVDYDAKNAFFRIREEVGNEYAVCCLALLGRLARWVDNKNKRRGDVLCIFEHGDDGQGNMIKQARDAGFNVMTQPKDKIRAFDACDLAAWKARSVVDDAMYRKKGGGEDELENLIKTIKQFDPVLHENGWMKPERLEESCKALPVTRREPLANPPALAETVSNAPPSPAELFERALRAHQPTWKRWGFRTEAYPLLRQIQDGIQALLTRNFSTGPENTQFYVDFVDRDELDALTLPTHKMRQSSSSR